jgi:hypothetical protein
MIEHSHRFLRSPVALVALLTLAVTDTAMGQMPFPREPEEDNREYVLDAVTNDYNRQWREMWDGGDNRFRLRVGSNNVTQWFLEEELKFSTNLIKNRLRFRFWHTRLLRNSSEQLTEDSFEFETRVFSNNYLSAFATPTSKRAENTIGLMLQNRRAVNRYSVLFIELPHVVRNFTEERKDGADSLNVVFTDKPVRLGLNIRERLRPGVWLRLEGEYVPEFTVIEEEAATGTVARSESAKAKSLGGWVEYNWRETDALAAKSAVGFEAGYRRDERAEGSSPLTNTLSSPRINEGIAPLGAQRIDEGFASVGVGDEGELPQKCDRLILMEFDKDLYWISADDSVTAWRNTRAYAKPYAWVVLNDRWLVRAAVQFERREIRRRNRQSTETVIENRYIAPAAAGRLSLGSRRQAIVELGWASLFRQRQERVGQSAPIETDFDDHRMFMTFEYVFSPNKRVRLIEAFELDGEDRGRYGIHDHGFFQMIFGF